MSNRGHTFQNKRKSSRYPVTGGSAVMLPLINVISYRVLDISKSGLSFCYNGKAKKSEGSNMAMTFFSAAMNAVDISVQVISDTELNMNHLLPYQLVSGDFRNPYMRRCGVKFHELSVEQEEAINRYIKHIEETTDAMPKSN